MPRKGLQFLVAEVVLLLDAKTITRHIQMHRRYLVDRVVVAALLPGGVDPVKLTQCRDLATGRNAAALGHAHPHEVNQALGDQRQILVHINE